MSFDEILKDLVCGVDGSVAATLMGMDGLAVQQYKREAMDCDIDAIGVEYGHLVAEIKKAEGILSLGDAEEVFVKGAQSGVLLRIVSDEYYIAFLLGASANLGRARYMIKKASRRAENELKA